MQRRFWRHESSKYLVHMFSLLTPIGNTIWFLTQHNNIGLLRSSKFNFSVWLTGKECRLQMVHGHCNWFPCCCCWYSISDERNIEHKINTLRYRYCAFIDINFRYLYTGLERNAHNYYLLLQFRYWSNTVFCAKRTPDFIVQRRCSNKRYLVRNLFELRNNGGSSPRRTPCYWHHVTCHDRLATWEASDLLYFRFRSAFGSAETVARYRLRTAGASQAPF